MNMNKLNLKYRLFLLIGVLIFAQASLVYVATTKSSSLLSTLNRQTNIILPATRDLTVADMMHDGLRALVFEALYSQETNNLEVIPDLKKESTEMGAKFATLIKDLQGLDLNPELTKKITSVQTDVKEYAETAISLIENLDKNKKEETKAAQEKFLTLFSKLEKELEDIGENFQEHSKSEGDAGTDILQGIIFWSALGLILSLAMSAFVFISTQKSFAEVLVDSEEVGDTLTGLIGSVRDEANKVREASIEQAAAIQESVSALSEMSSMIAQTSQNVKMSLDTSQNALQKTVEGKEIMNRMAHSMTAIQKSNVQLQDLSKVIDDIHSKTTIINDIVFKTQLLSFNASIEAARAGQHGRGFAVVAEEVGNLAEMSGQAAKDIELLLGDSQRKVKETLETIQNRVNDSNRVSQLALQAFQEVATNIDEINGQVRSINEATQQQEIGIQQTNIAMKQVDVTSQANTNSSSEALEQANELKSKSELLASANQRLSFLVRGGEYINTDKKMSSTLEKKSSQTSPEKNGKMESLIAKITSQKHKTSLAAPPSNENEITADDPDFKKMAS